MPNFLHFYRDFQHVAVPGPEWQPQHQRCFKYVRGMKYNSHPVVTDPAGHCTYFSPHYQNRRVILNDFFIYHYGYARPNMDQIMQDKQKYYKGELAKHGGADQKFDQKVKDWIDGTEPTLVFTGDHPEIMRDYSMFSSVSEDAEIGTLWTEDAFYSKVLNNEDYGNIYLCMTGQSKPYMQHYHNGMNVD